MRSSGAVLPSAIERKPGVIQSATETMKQRSVFFWARLQPPSSASFCWMKRSAPSMRATSAGKMWLRTR